MSYSYILPYSWIDRRKPLPPWSLLPYNRTNHSHRDLPPRNILNRVSRKWLYAMPRGFGMCYNNRRTTIMPRRKVRPREFNVLYRL
jgi:hypothetical protein